MTQVLERPLEQAGVSTEAANPFSLARIVSSHHFPPLKVVVYGVPGVGKTTFASTWPNPILLRTEDGASALDIPTFPMVVSQIEQLRMAMGALFNEKHDFQTLILDSLDWAEPFVWDVVCKEENKPNIESFGYGKGYVMVDKKWQGIQMALDMLRRKKKMHIVCIAHAVPQVFDPPDNDPYMRYNVKLHKRAASLWTEWAEMLLFINYQTNVIASDNGGKSKAKGTGDRVIFTQERPAWLAKTRWPLPEQIYIGNDPTWQAFHSELNKATSGAYSND